APPTCVSIAGCCCQARRASAFSAVRAEPASRCATRATSSSSPPPSPTRNHHLGEYYGCWGDAGAAPGGFGGASPVCGGGGAPPPGCPGAGAFAGPPWFVRPAGVGTAPGSGTGGFVGSA